MRGYVLDCQHGDQPTNCWLLRGVGAGPEVCMLHRDLKPSNVLLHAPVSTVGNLGQGERERNALASTRARTNTLHVQTRSHAHSKERRGCETDRMDPFGG